MLRLPTRGGVGTTIATRGGVCTTITTRGGRRPQHANCLNRGLGIPVQSAKPTVCTTVVTRGGCRPQHANPQGIGTTVVTRGGARTQNKSVDAHTLDDHPGGWHTNRGSWRAILVSHLAISCRDPKRFGPAIATRGGCRPQPESNQRCKTGS